MSKKRAFSLVEMLVVISVVTLLIGILAPALQHSKENARAVYCLTNLRSLGTATNTLTNDTGGRLPGIWDSVWINLKKPGGGCWLSNPPAGQSYFYSGPHTGELFSYVGKDEKTYRCPSLEAGVLNSGNGSNGRYDYSAFHAFAGATYYRVPPSSTIPVKDGLQIPTPWIIEESPSQYLNAGHVEGGFGGGDIIGSWHLGNNHLVSFDGSAMAIKNAVGLSSFHFYARTPKGHIVNLASHTSGYGGWDGR
ncbi:MAG: type II secretion system protein [Phycisphaeraceae bacterium]